MKNILTIGLSEDSLNSIQLVAMKKDISVTSVQTIEFNSEEYYQVDIVVINDSVGSVNELVTNIKRTTGAVVVIITDDQDLQYRMSLLWAGCDKFIEDDSSLKYEIENIEIIDFDHQFKKELYNTPVIFENKTVYLEPRAYDLLAYNIFANDNVETKHEILKNIENIDITRITEIENLITSGITKVL